MDLRDRPSKQVVADWSRIARRLDSAIAAAVARHERDITARGLHHDTAGWARELNELRLGREPDYEFPGLAIAYALRYMPKRVLTVFGTLAQITSKRPATVVDMGSGTGATALALDLFGGPGPTDVHGIDPSTEMRTFAAQLALSRGVSAHYSSGRVENFLGGFLAVARPQLVVFSATFAYGADVAALLADVPYEQHVATTLVVILPEAKSALMDAAARRLRRNGWPTISMRGQELAPAAAGAYLPLNDLTRAWRRLDGRELSRPQAWWDSPDDSILVANAGALDRAAATAARS